MVGWTLAMEALVVDGEERGRGRRGRREMRRVRGDKIIVEGGGRRRERKEMIRDRGKMREGLGERIKEQSEVWEKGREKRSRVEEREVER